MSGLCLAAGLITAALPFSAFTLAWTHSIEKIRWEEDYHIARGHLILDEARIRGSGAGMEPPPNAQLRDGVWHYRPELAPLTSLRLSHSPYTSGYELCHSARCQPLAALLPGLPEFALIEVLPCARQP